jgi:hypothetical protein
MSYGAAARGGLAFREVTAEPQISRRRTRSVSAANGWFHGRIGFPLARERG